MRRVLVLLAAIGLAGCANWPKHGVDPKKGQRLRIALLPVRCTASKVKDPARVVADLTTALNDDLRAVPEFELVTASVTVLTSSFTAAQLRAIAKDSGAQALLEVEISGYGKIKTRTVMRHIGISGVRATVAGALVAGPAGPVAGALAFTYAIGQGVVLWTSGTFIFNRIYTPVVLDGRLYSGADGRLIWADDATAVINREALKQLSKSGRKDKESRLSLAAEKATAKLVDFLSEDARAHLKTLRRPPQKEKPEVPMGAPPREPGPR